MLNQGTTAADAPSSGHRSPEARQAFWVKCGKCSHCWAAAYLPMEATKFAKVAKASCPMCAAPPKEVFIAKQKDGILMEQGK